MSGCNRSWHLTTSVHPVTNILSKWHFCFSVAAWWFHPWSVCLGNLLINRLTKTSQICIADLLCGEYSGRLPQHTEGQYDVSIVMIHGTVDCHCDTTITIRSHDAVIKWKHFPRYWPFVRGIHRSHCTNMFTRKTSFCILFQSSLEFVIIASGNDMAPNRQQAITRSQDRPVYYS